MSKTTQEVLVEFTDAVGKLVEVVVESVKSDVETLLNGLLGGRK